MTISPLFAPLTLRGLTIKNRIFLPPMCQYQAGEDGIPTDWHLVHYGARAAGGFGLIMVEATGVSPEARISPNCVGLWNDEQAEAWKPIVKFAHSLRAAIGVQLIHAGRKASSFPGLPGYASGTVPLEEGGWVTKAPSPEPFPGYVPPQELTVSDIAAVVADFQAAARRAVAAGFDTVEIHGAHGYLLHQFLSPVSNHRTDDYGGSFDNRARIVIEIIDAIREVIPADMPLLLRLSATDWLENVPGVESWGIPETIQLATLAQEHGVDMVDVSSGGLVPAPISTGPGYQVPLANAVREAAGIPVVAVGELGDPLTAQQVLVDGLADAIDVGRAALFEPQWPLRAARELGLPSDDWPVAPSYSRGVWG